MLRFIAPAVFVLIWSTGFIVARAIDGVADPDLFLLARFVLTAALFAMLASLQPMVTALIAQRLFAEPVGRRFRSGLLAGAVGVVLVLAPRLATVGAGALSPLVVAVALLSVAGITAGTLLVWMVRRGSAARVSVLVLLVPPLAAVQAALLFGERLEPVQIAGFVLALAGVLLCRRAPS